MSKKVRGKWKLPPMWSGPFSFSDGASRDPDTVYGCKKNGFWPERMPHFNTPKEAVEQAWKMFLEDLNDLLGWDKAQWEAMEKAMADRNAADPMADEDEEEDEDDEDDEELCERLVAHHFPNVTAKAKIVARNAVLVGIAAGRTSSTSVHAAPGS